MKMGARSWSTAAASPAAASGGGSSAAESYPSGPLFPTSSSSPGSGSAACFAVARAGRQHLHPPAQTVVGETHLTSKELVVAVQRAERSLAVHRDLILDLPTCVSLPDGEELPYGASRHFRIHDQQQESEIRREYIRPPPNRTAPRPDVSNPPFRSYSEGILSASKMKASGGGGGGGGSGGAVSRGAKKANGGSSHGGSSTSSPSSILAVCCAAGGSSSSTSSSNASLLDPSDHLHYHYHHHHHRASDELSRLLLDMDGQPIVTRSKSMSTGSSYVHPSSSRLEATVKSCVRSIKECLTGVDPSSSQSDASRRRSSDLQDRPLLCSSSPPPPPSLQTPTSSSALLASLPVLTCDSSSEGTTPRLSSGL